MVVRRGVVVLWNRRVSSGIGLSEVGSVCSEEAWI